MRQVAQSTKVLVRSWSKDGWKTKEASPKQKKAMTVHRSRAPYQPTEFENSGAITCDVDLLNSVQSEIQTGLASDKMDELPNSFKQLLYSPDVWHVANNKIMRVVDPITQAKDGGWGADNSEADLDVLGEGRSAIRMLLEDCQIVGGEDTTEDYQDLMGELLETGNGELIPNSPMVRVDMAVQHVGEDEEEHDSDGYVTEFQEPTPIVPHISEDVREQILTIRDEYVGKIAETNSDEEREVLVLTMDQLIDQVASRELCNRLDSPYCGYKYSQPRRKHELILTGKTSPLTEAARKREEFFYTLLAEASSCKSMEALHGGVVEEIYTDTETGEEKVRRGRPGGFAGKIRGMYQHDKDLAREWSLAGDESAFSTQRTVLLKRLRAEGKDEETIRKSVFAWFDREAGEVPAVYKDGQLIQESKKWKDSIWRQKRTNALKDLFLTKAQWNAIYKMVNLQKERIKLNTKTNEDERKAISILQKHFERVTNLQDLNAYRRWAEKREFVYRTEYTTYKDQNGAERKRFSRKWNTYDFKPCMLDYLSTTNAARWWKAIMKKQRHLQNRIALFNKLNEGILSVEETGLSEVSVACKSPKCQQMAIGCPQFANLESNKGHLFVECECGHKNWLIGYKESGSDIKSKEEAIAQQEG